MPFSLIRFNLIDPTLDSESLSDRYKAMLEMAEFVDEHGFFMATFEEAARKYSKEKGVFFSYASRNNQL